MPTLTPVQIAQKLDEIAFLKQQVGEDFYRFRAYTKAADIIRQLPSIDPTNLANIPGIGSSIFNVITELIQTGTCKKLEDLQKKAPPVTIVEFTRLPKIGAVGARKIWDTYGVANLVELEKAITTGKITDQKLIDGLALVKRQSERIPLYQVLPLTLQLIEEIQSKCPFIKEIQPAGSMRRMRETVRDIDILIGIKEQDRQKFIQCMRKNYKVVEGGENKLYIDVDWPGRTQRIDLNIAAVEHYWAYINYLTGSRDFNVELRKLALTKGFSINQYWVENTKTKERIYLEDEKYLFDILKLPYVPPECRETGDEIGKDFSDLVTWNDLETDYHIHTKFSDGADINQVVASARKFGYSEIGIADHSHSTFGLKADGIRKYSQEVRSLSCKKLKVQVGIEMDTMKSGQMDFTDEELKPLDYVIIAAHRQPGENLEGRYIAAMQSINKPKIIAHPTCRLLGEREMPENVNWDEIFRIAKETETAIEINAQQDRLDMPWYLVRKAIGEYGLKVTINSDQHGLDFWFLKNGLMEARKGLVKKGDLFKL